MLGWARLPLASFRSHPLASFALNKTTSWRIFLVSIGVLFLWTVTRRDLARIPPFLENAYSGVAKYRYGSDSSKAEAVKEAFIHAWTSYRQHAFPHNELMPVSKSFLDTSAVWGTTAVDSLSTAILMNLPDVVNNILDHISTVDFTTADSDMTVSVLQSTGTFIGGMLSAHDLLTGPKSRLVRDKSKPAMLLQKAQSLAEHLTFAFNTASKLPQDALAFKPKPKHQKVSTTDTTAAGGLILEWAHLSETTNDKTYVALASHAEDVVFDAFDPQNDRCKNLTEGLAGKVMRLRTGKYQSYNGGYLIESGLFYEYLIKMYLYSPEKYGSYRDRWIKAADATMKHLTSHPPGRPDITFLASYDCARIINIGDYTGFSAAANFILGGSVLHEQKYIDFGLRLVESQVAQHRASYTGLGPERWQWLPEKCKNGANAKAPECQLPRTCSRQKEFIDKNGYCILDSQSRLRPDALESLYYAYRVTRDTKYQEMSWDIFQAINRTARVWSGGFSEIENVNDMIPPARYRLSGRVDIMYSWFMAETLKYAYLIQVADRDETKPDEWHPRPDGNNQWVFNSRGHPIMVKERIGKKS